MEAGILVALLQRKKGGGVGWGGSHGNVVNSRVNKGRKETR